MQKTFIGPQLRQLRRQRNQTQAEMARSLGISASYVNLLENNQRSLSVQILMAISDAYQVDWRDLVNDDSSNLLADLRNAMNDPGLSSIKPDLQELRAAIDHAPKLVETFLSLYRNHRSAIQRLMRQGSGRMPEELLASSPEAIIHDFFRDHSNYFEALEEAAERLRAEEPCAADDVYAALKARLSRVHKTTVEVRPIEEMSQTLRIHDTEKNIVLLSEALSYPNRVFQLAHVLCLIEFQSTLDDLTKDSRLTADAGRVRCHVELANYFAAAYLMPYDATLETARRTKYDVNRIASTFGVSFEQTCHRLTTLQRENARGVPFFFLRIDKAGNVTKRFNSTSFNLAEHGGACPVWNIHTCFRTPGIIVPQFVELPDGDKFFTISRTADRPAYDRDSQDRRLAVALGCEQQYADRLIYTEGFALDDDRLFSPIGINCHLCPRQACSQRAHQPLFVELPIDTSRRGETRYES